MESSASTSPVARNTRANKRCADSSMNQTEELKRMKLDDDDGENRKEESYFNTLLEMVLDCVIRLKQIPEREIAKSISSIICEFKHGPAQRFSQVDLKRWENICGYLFRYGLHGASLTRIKVLEAIRNCSVLRSVLKNRQLRVITLGGGPGNDTIGFCSALQDYHKNSQINLTVVDAAREWSLCVNLVNSIIPEGEFGNISKLFNNNNVNLSFLNVHLPGDRQLHKKYFQKLEKADIILMTKFISSLSWNERRSMIKVNAFFNLYCIN